MASKQIPEYQITKAANGLYKLQYKVDYDDSIYTREYPNLWELLKDIRDKFGGTFANKIERDLKHKDISTNRKLSNPSETHEAASILARKFHGRDNVDTATAIIQEGYHSSLAVLGLLEELEVITDEDSEEVTPIEFDEDDNIIVASNPNGTALYLIGEADLDDEDLEDMGLDEDEISKDLVEIGHIHAISYFADKHHLEGPKYQEKGASYRHEFGEEGGTLPALYLNKLSNELSILGGSYKIEEEGIKN